MPNPFAGLFGKSSQAGDDDTEARLEAAAAVGARIATLEADLKAEQDKSAATQASLDTATGSLNAALDALREQAKAAAVIAYGVQSEATVAEHALIATTSDPAQLAALTARYRAAIPAALSQENAGTRHSQQAAQSAPKVGADRLAEIEKQREEGQRAAQARRQQDARRGRGGAK